MLNLSWELDFASLLWKLSFPESLAYTLQGEYDGKV